jgi:hypothetical protein
MDNDEFQKIMKEAGRSIVTFMGKPYSLSCFEPCEPKEATFRLEESGLVIWVKNKRDDSSPFPGTYFRFKNGEVLDLIEETSLLNRQIINMKKERFYKVQKLLELGYAKVVTTGTVGCMRFVIVSPDKEWLSSIETIGQAFMEQRPPMFIIDWEV